MELFIYWLYTINQYSIVPYNITVIIQYSKYIEISYHYTIV